MSPSGITAVLPCRHCDAPISAIAEICPHCGVRQDPAQLTTPGATSEKKLTGTALVQLFTLGGLGLWMLCDLILILTAQFRDADDKRVVDPV